MWGEYYPETLDLYRPLSNQELRQLLVNESIPSKIKRLFCGLKELACNYVLYQAERLIGESWERRACSEVWALIKVGGFFFLCAAYVIAGLICSGGAR